MQIAQIQLRIHYCTPCSDAISGPKNRVCEIKSGHDFCRYRNSIQVIYFQINDIYSFAILRLTSIIILRVISINEVRTNTLFSTLRHTIDISRDTEHAIYTETHNKRAPFASAMCERKS